MAWPRPYGMTSRPDDECHLVSENYAYALQLILGFSALAGLVLKRWRAPVKRDLVVWMYDVSKQAFGAMFIHVWNIILSIREGGEDTVSDECAMYFVNFSLDIAIGTFVIWCFVRVQELTARRFGIESLKVTGDYGTPPLFSVYRIQLAVYMVILIVCKSVTTLIVITADEVLSSLANALFAPVRDYPDLELTIVMIICPWILNALQFWVLDNVLMSEKTIADIRVTEFAKYAHMSASAPCDAGREATERDGLNTPPLLPDEPMWLSDSGGSPDGGEPTTGRGLGWRGGRRGGDADRGATGSSRARTHVLDV